MTESVVRSILLIDQRLYLHRVSNINSLSHCFLFACDQNYHLTGEIPSYVIGKDVLTLAIGYGRIVYVYKEVSQEFILYNSNGIGCLVLYEDITGQYWVVGEMNSKGQHDVLFSSHSKVIKKIEDSILKSLSLKL